MEEVQEGRGLMASLTRIAAKARQWWSETVVPWAKGNPKTAALVTAGAAIGGIVYMGSAVLINGLIAGVLVSGAAGILIWKMKASNNRYLVQGYNTMVEHPLLSDVAISVIAIAVAPSGITGWVAGSIAALLASVWLLGADTVALPMDPQEKLVATSEEV